MVSRWQTYDDTDPVYDHRVQTAIDLMVGVDECWLTTLSKLTQRQIYEAFTREAKRRGIK